MERRRRSHTQPNRIRTHAQSVPWPSTMAVLALLFAASVFAASVEAQPAAPGVELPTGQIITPRAAAGAVFQELDPELAGESKLRAGHAAAVATSPDGKTLAILTSGSSRSYDANLKARSELSMEYVFLFDLRAREPRQLQVLQLPNTFQGLAWAPASDRLFAAGGKDDAVVEFAKTGASFAPARTFHLKHAAGLGIDVKPVAGGLAVSPDGSRLLIANLENDSVTLVDLASGEILAEQDLRPGIIDPTHRGEAGGSFPRSVVWSTANHAYIASERDREVVSLSIAGSAIRVVTRIPVHGQPVAVLANRTGSRVYAALATTDEVAIIDTAHDTILESLDATAPASVYPNTQKLGGANSNALALTPDERTLLVSNGGQNSLAVIRLSDRARGEALRSRDERDDDGAAPNVERSTVIGLVPTGWYPTGVATSKNGATWYVVNGKSETGPNVGWCVKQSTPQGHCAPATELLHPPYAANGTAVLRPAHEDVFQLEKAGFLTLPAPSALELARLTRQVAHNNHFDHPETLARDQRLFAFLRAHIKHVIYIVKENRTYDQVLGDLPTGNGDPRLTLFPQAITPNHHALASEFVTLDNFLVSGEGSWSGWDWSVSAQTNDFRERNEPIAGRGGTAGEQTGFNRNINLGYPSSLERRAAVVASVADPDVLPGERDVTAPDGPGGEEGAGHLWDIALKHKRSLRNWGFFGENRAFPAPSVPLIHDPYGQKQRVFFPTRSALAPLSDPYYLDFAPAYPDFWRVKEWQREFDQFAAKKSAPQLMLIRLGNDHFGSFDVAIDGVNTPETQMADNDYALGLIIQAVALSPFANNTVIISIEDDASDGPDHVDAHRSVALFAGPYVRQNALVSTRYTTVNVVKTIEAILGLGPIGLNDALAVPMSEVFEQTLRPWDFKALVPDVLRSTQLPLPAAMHAAHAVPTRSSAYWTEVMAGQDFSSADRLDNGAFNRALWQGLKGNSPYPATPSGEDLRPERARLLKISE